MADSASLIVRVSSTGVSSTQRSLASLEKQSERSEKAALALKTSMNLAVAGIIAVGAASLKSIYDNKRFEKSLSDLSAITGSTGKQLEYMSAQARDIGATTSLSASEASEAFKLIASAKPDLLESASALNEVTRAAVTLAEAAGTTLPEAADTLGSSLNQFGADADEASRFINVLAAGSKFGASSVADVSVALKNAGVAASSVKVSFEETNAAIQQLAAVGIKGGEAGTGLRNILLKLESDSNDKLKPSINGLVGSLKNLSELQEDTTQLTKRFGLENVITAQSLITNVSSLDDLIIKLTGTNTALEQSKTRTNNLDGDLKKLASSTEALSLAIGEKLNPSARSGTQFLTELASAAAQTIDAMGGAPKTIDGIALRMADVNEQIKDLEARNKRFGANGIFDALFGGAGDKEKQLKALNDELSVLTSKYNDLQGLTTPDATKLPVAMPSAAGIASGATGKTESELRSDLEAESAKRLFETKKQAADNYIEKLKQANLTELELIDAQENEKINKVLSYRELNLISEQEYQDALKEITATASTDRADLEIEAARKIASEKERIADEEARIQERLSDAKQKVIDDGISAQRNMTSDLKSVLGEQSSIYKASAIASATIDTYKAATGAYSAMASIPYIGPVLGAVAAGAAITAGLANVAAIRGAREQGGSMSAGSAYQMAERGKAEVIVPSGSSRARTAAQMKDIMGESNSSWPTQITIVNNTTGRIDSATSETDSEGQLMITISEVVSSAILSEDSQITKALKATRGQPGY